MTVHRHNDTFNYSVLISVVLGFGVSSLSASQLSEWKTKRDGLQESKELDRLLEVERQVLFEQCAFKRGTVEELSDGRITLKEAAARFISLDAGWPLVRRHVLTQFTGTSELEKEARCAAHMACDRQRDLLVRLSLYARLADEFLALFPGSRPLTLSSQIPVRVIG
jgi:hypothetical protein